MGLLKISHWLGGIAATSAIVGLAVTNPNSTAYETYATEQLSEFLLTQFCEGDMPEALSQMVAEQCEPLLVNNQEQIRQLISEHTSRANYGVFSIYQTQFAIAGLAILPAYEFKTLGIGKHFFTYKAGQM